MILLEYESAILRNLLERSLDPNEEVSSDYIFCDLDGVRYCVKFTREKSGKKHHHDKQQKTESDVREILVMIYIACAKEINDFGVEDQFNALYGDIKAEPVRVKSSPVQFTHAIKFQLYGKSKEEQDKLITLACRLKANILGAPFIYVADLVEQGSNFAPFEIPYRAQTGESIYITPTDQGAAATYSIRFSDEGDKIIGGVFFQELQAARQRVPSAPTVTYSNDPPSDLGAFNLPTRDQKLFAYVTIGMQKSQLSQRKKQDISFYMPMFRDYLHYHIKCAKGFMHQKMRARTASLLKILDAAKPEPKHKVRRTITGKVME